VRKSFKKKKDAVAELGKRVSLIAENRYLDVKKDYKTTLKELTEKYEENFKHQPSFYNGKKRYLENFREHFGEDTRLANIRYVDLETYRNKLINTPIRWGTLRTEAAINREISCLHHILTKAVEWEMMEQSPFDKGKSLWLKENNQRNRYLTEEEIDRLLEECKPVKHLYRVVKTALHTGMRRGEILSLKWEQIRNGFIYLKETKTKNPREIPVNDELEELFKEIRREQGLRFQKVFTYQPNQNSRWNPAKNLNVAAHKELKRFDTAWRGALKRSGIENFTFHDLRHTFASHVLMRGGSLKDVQELLGHKNIKMTMRYAHLSQEHKKKAVNLLNGLTASVKSDMSQKRHISTLPSTSHQKD
jgi:integrase